MRRRLCKDWVSGVVLLGLVAATAMRPARADDAVAVTGGTITSVSAANALLNKVVLVGASVSAGFTQSELFGGPETAGYRLKHYFDAAILDEHQPTEAFGSTFFFMNPEKSATELITKAQAAEPSLLVAVDFLFWFCYGEGLTAEQRLEMFEKGLKMLEKVDGPLVVGDIPYAASAVDRILSKGQLPPKEIVDFCNARLKAWASRRDQTAIVPLSSFLEAAMADKPLAVQSQQWAEGTTRALLQDDHLHPSHHGCVGLTFFVLDAAIKANTSVSPECICWDLKKVHEEALEASRPPATANKQEAEKQDPE